MPWVRPLLAFLTSAWMVVLLAAPTERLGVPVAALTYAFGSLICHQRPERSFHLAAAQLPVCARCLGLYLGAAIGVFAVLRRRVAPFAAVEGCVTSNTTRCLRRLLLWAAVPTAITWTSEVSGMWAPSNEARFLAALPLGAAVALTVNYVGCARPPRTGSSPPRIPF